MSGAKPVRQSIDVLTANSRARNLAIAATFSREVYWVEHPK